MPYYSELGLTSTPSSAYSSLLFSGPYSNHSSIIASNYQPFSKPLSRQIRGGFTPHLTTISELNSPLRRINSPKYHSRPFRPVIKTINTADIDVSHNRYRKFEKYERPKTDSVERVVIEKAVSPKRPEPPKKIESPRTSVEERDAKPNPTIRRDRATVRLQTVHTDTLEKEIGEIKSWRDNFKPDELGEGEVKRRKKSPGEILKDKFLIRSRSKENILKGQSIKKKKLSVKKSPSFHDICQAITSDNIEDELNPGQPVAIQRRQSRQLSTDKIIKEIRRRSTDLSEEDIKILDEIITKQENMSEPTTQLLPSRASVRKKKVTKKKSVVENGTEPSTKETENITDSEPQQGIQRQRMQKRAKRTTSNSSNNSETTESDAEVVNAYKTMVRDISQVDIEETKYKPKPIITASDIGIEPTKPTLKAVIDDVEVEESPKKKEKKFRFNVIVEVEEKPKKPPITAPKMTLTDAKVLIPKPKEPVITSILKKHSSTGTGQILEGKEKKVKPKPLILEEVTNLDSKSSPTTEVITESNTSPLSTKFNVLNKKCNNSTPELAEKFQVPLSKTQSASNPFQKTEIQSPTIKNKFSIGKSNTPSPTSTIKRTEFPTPLKTPTKAWFEEQSPSIPSSPLKRTGNFFNKENDSNVNKIVEEANNKQQNEINTISKEKTPERETVMEKTNSNIPKDVPTDKGRDGKPTKAWFEESTSIPSSPVYSNQKFFKKELKTVEPKEESENSTQKPDKLDLNVSNNQNKIDKPVPASVDITTEGQKDPEKRKTKLVENSPGKQNETDYKDSTIEETRKKKITPKREANKTNTKEVTENTPEKQTETNQKDNAAEETEKKKKLISKRSLVQKATIDDPDLEVFVPPEPEQQPEPEPQPKEGEKEQFVPLQSNRMSQWMHPWKKPAQFDVCPVEIFARPKLIRGRHYPRPRGHPAQVSPSEESSSEEESDDETEESSSSSEEDTSSEEECDSGFGSKDKGSSESRDSPTTNHANNPAFALDFGDLPEEFSQSSTFAGFQKSGRITPPATTIPRFRKYCVDDFNFLKVLGKGSFGKVLLAELKGTEYYYAVKCLKKDVVLEDDDVECTLIERKVLALGTKHPYLCHLLCTFQTESHLFFVMEYLNGGDLMFHIQASGRFPEHQARFYGAEIISGLKFLHNKGIVYRDLKLDNVLLDFDGHVRIADFGMCKLQIFLDRMAETFCGTPDYMAPEIIKGLHYNQCVDWWSFGVLLYEMLLGQSPFSGCDEDELFWSICNEKPVLPKFLSSEATNVLTLLLEKDASKRLGNRFCPHGDLQDHAFFRPIDWIALEARQLDSPFKPNLQHPLDTQYFDKHFTIEKAKITPIEPTILQSMDQTQFQGFSYTNPNATDK